MRILAVMAAGAALMFASVAGANPVEETDDRMTEALLSTDFDGIAENQIAERSTGQAFMVANPGNAAAVVVGCEQRCQGIQIRLRVMGQPDLVTRTQEQSLVLEIPREYTRTLSNFELDVDVSCGGADCVRRWALTTRGSTPSLQARGLPRPVTDAEWTAAGEAVPLSQINWTSSPSAEDLRFFYPVRQWRAAEAGAARLQCLVGRAGALRCRAEGRSQFNEAAVKLATRLRAPANDTNGQPLANRRIIVPIRFEPQS